MSDQTRRKTFWIFKKGDENDPDATAVIVARSVERAKELLYLKLLKPDTRQLRRDADTRDESEIPDYQQQLCELGWDASCNGLGPVGEGADLVILVEGPRVSLASLPEGTALR